MAATGSRAGDRGEAAQRADGGRAGREQAAAAQGAQAAAAQGHHVHGGRQHGVWDQLRQVGGLRRDGHGRAQGFWRPGPSRKSRHCEGHGPGERWGPGPRGPADESVIAVDAVDVALQHGLSPGFGLGLQRLQGHPGPRPCGRACRMTIHCRNAHSIPGTQRPRRTWCLTLIPQAWNGPRRTWESAEMWVGVSGGVGQGSQPAASS